MKGNIKYEGGQDRGKLRDEELWMPKEEEKCHCHKVRATLIQCWVS